jgi:CBS domain containing-hemolysin-like protein
MNDNDLTSMIVLGLLIIVSAFFSATETAYSSLNKIRLKNMAQSGDKKARIAQDLSDRFDRLLSTILIGNNIVNIAAASIATVLFTRHYADLGVTLSTIFMTVVILIFGEITPKSLAKDSPERFAVAIAPILRLIYYLLTPLNFLFMLWKNLLSKIFKQNDDRAITEEELMTMVDEAENEGGINSEESELIRSAIEFNETDVEAILTPRVDVIAIDENTDMQEIARIFRLYGYSRLPVYRGTIDTIIGVLHEKDFYNLLYKNATSIDSAVKSVICATGNMKIPTLLRLLQQDKSHIAVVVDEFGGTEGIVTLEDILEELVGEIWDEHDEVIELYQQINDTTYLVSGNANLEDTFEIIGYEPSEEYDALNVNGWIIEEFGRLPMEGESFEMDRYRVTVKKIDFRRVVEILIETLPEQKEDNHNKQK